MAPSGNLDYLSDHSEVYLALTFPKATDNERPIKNRYVLVYECNPFQPQIYQGSAPDNRFSGAFLGSSTQPSTHQLTLICYIALWPGDPYSVPEDLSSHSRASPPRGLISYFYKRKKANVLLIGESRLVVRQHEAVLSERF